MNTAHRFFVILPAVLGLFLSATGVHAEGSKSSPLPRIVKQGTSTRLFVDEKPFTIMGAELHNSSASNLDYVKPILRNLGKLNVNTVLAPIAWEQFEPVEGGYDYTLIDGLVAQAREQKLRLVVLWFGSWKNAHSSYVPSWVKMDWVRFPRMKLTNEKPESLSPFADTTREADARAFAALMRHLGQMDANDHTVIMVQVENESGVLHDSRDRSPLGEAAFAKPVPTELIEYMKSHKDNLIPELQRAWGGTGFRTSGTWTEVFGDDADEFFMAWHFAQFIDYVAAKGKAEYSLPMYVNAWIIRTTETSVAKELAGLAGGAKPGQYPSGGPVSKVHDIYRAAAPHIDLLAPDIYLPNFKAATASYTRSNNALFIPEAKNEPDVVAKAFYAFGQHDAIGFAPFGIDELAEDNPLVEGYKVLAGLAPLIQLYAPQGKVVGILQYKAVENNSANEAKKDAKKTGEDTAKKEEENNGEIIRMGDLNVNVTYGNINSKVPGYGIIIATAPDEYIIAGAGLGVSFSSAIPDAKIIRMLQIDEGQLVEGKWIPGRRINGDESNHNSRLSFPGGSPTIRKVKLYSCE